MKVIASLMKSEPVRLALAAAVQKAVEVAMAKLKSKGEKVTPEQEESVKGEAIAVFTTITKAEAMGASLRELLEKASGEEELREGIKMILVENFLEEEQK